MDYCVKVVIRELIWGQLNLWVVWVAMKMTVKLVA